MRERSSTAEQLAFTQTVASSILVAPSVFGMDAQQDVHRPLKSDEADSSSAHPIRVRLMAGRPPLERLIGVRPSDPELVRAA